MELKEGMYVRSNRGIFKINKTETCCYIDGKECVYVENKEEDLFSFLLKIEDIVEASFNIVDLIKKGDILLGKDEKLYQCWKVYKDYVFTYSKNKEGITITLVDYQIDRVLTKEQFESMSYKV